MNLKTSNIIKLGTLLFLLLYAVVVNAQEFRGAMYELKNYTTLDYKQHPQNWASVQADTKLMYFANNNGVVEFDGSIWNLITLPNKSSITSLAKGNDGTIYVGAEDEFGYLKADSLSKMNYFSLKAKVPKEFKDFKSVKKILKLGEKIIFQTSKYLLIYENDTIIGFDAGVSLLFSSVFENKVYISNVTQQILVFSGNKFVKIDLPTEFLSKGFVVMLAYTKGVALVGNSDHLFLFDTEKQKFTKFETSANKFLEENKVYSGVQIDENFYAIGTLRGGLVIFDKKGIVQNYYTTKKGLKNQSVLSVDKDLSGNLWLSLSNGITLLNNNSQFTYFNEYCGLNGITESVLVSEKGIYAGTILGVFKQNEDLNFNLLEGSNGESWYIKEIDGDILCSHRDGLFKIIDEKFIPIYQNSNSWTFIELKHNKNDANNKQVIISGSNTGLLVVKKQNGNWKLISKIKGFNLVCRWIQEDIEGNIWVSEEYKGVYKLQLNNALDSVIKQTHYGIKEGLPELEYNYLFKINNKQFNEKLVLGTNLGIFHLVNNKFEPFVQLNKYIDAKDWAYGMVSDAKNNIYLQNGNNIFALNFNENEYIPVSKPFKKFKNPLVEAIYPINSSAILFASKDGVGIYNPEKKHNYEQKFPTYIRKIILSDSVIYQGAGEKVEQLLAYYKNNIQFHFVATTYENHEAVKYSYKLEGYQDKWSAWSTKKEKEFTNLFEGKYTFHVKSKNIYGTQSTEDNFSFVILPPWYRTTYAYIGGVILLFLLFYLGLKLYTKKLQADKVKLEEIVSLRTYEILEKNEELLQQKEEITAQAEQMEKINVQLEKLSIVASETDNAVAIMDKNAQFEWINEGFTKLYGYNFEEFSAKYKNLFEVSSQPEINEIIQKCIDKKETFIYESVTEAKNGNKIWVQTTLTPILGNDGKINKIIAIDSDIHKLKQIEEELSYKNEHITDSIRYAKTIQTAILPIKQVIDNKFENFIFFQPKDIVSGDFYWHVETENYQFFAAADCTGHGVPGAFMSMIGSSLLNQIVYHNQEYSTEKILGKLHELIVQSLRQKESDNTDGMDICLCRIETQTHTFKVQFTGAKRPLYFFKKGNSTVKILKADRKSIGGTQKKKVDFKFTAQEIELGKGDTIYLSSDGFIDQNNVDRKKFGSSRLIKLLEENTNENMEKQKQVLSSALENWMENTSQRDDITILGIRL